VRAKYCNKATNIYCTFSVYGPCGNVDDNQSINQSITPFANSRLQLHQVNKKEIWQAAGTGKSPTKLATFKKEKKTDVDKPDIM